MHTLTSERVVRSSVKRAWTAQSLLRDIASQSGDDTANVLIDTGALITGMDNREVAEFLLVHLRDEVEGVVYLDRSDRKMILMREGGRSVGLDQCGVSPENYFTFYDQVHTTGMDIKQGPTAHAIVTVGKDMTFRDYAQGCYRMRGIGQGQTIELYVIPEVQNRIQADLLDRTGDLVLDVPAWLVLNSMRMEGLQFVQLQLQELHNGWRKKAMASLTDEVRANKPATGLRGTKGMRRFLGDGEEPEWLRKCVAKFRENIGFPVPDKVPVPKRFSDTVASLIEENDDFITEDVDFERVVLIQTRVADTTSNKATAGAAAADAGGKSSGGGGTAAQLQATVVHENEKQQEEEAQKQVRQQKIKQSAFARDDEQPHPWKVGLLAASTSIKGFSSDASAVTGSAFYEFRRFTTRDDIRPVAFPPSLLLTDNFFRASWVGLGDRRLKNVGIMMEWVPVGTDAEAQALLRDPLRQPSSSTVEIAEVGEAKEEAPPPAPQAEAPSAAPAAPPAPFVPTPAPDWQARMGQLHAEIMQETGASATDAAVGAITKLRAEIAAFEALSKREAEEHAQKTVAGASAPASKEEAAVAAAATTKKAVPRQRPAFYEDDSAPKLPLTDWSKYPRIDMTAEASGQKEGAPQTKRFMVALSLAEGETIRRLIHDHRAQPVLRHCGIALRTSEGRLLDVSPRFPQTLVAGQSGVDAMVGAAAAAAVAGGGAPAPATKTSAPVASTPTGIDVQCLRFFNSEMYYTDAQVQVLSKALKLSPVNDRLALFEETLRLRQRERNLWTDTPVAKIFTREEDWHLMRARSALNRLNAVLSGVAQDGGAIPTSTLVRLFASPEQQECRAKKQHQERQNTGGGGKTAEIPAAKSAREFLSHEWTPSVATIRDSVFAQFDEDKDGRLSVEDVHRCGQALGLKFDVQDCVALVRLVDRSGDEKISKPEFSDAFLAADKRAHLPADCAVGQVSVDALDFWNCPNCDFLNAAQNDVCVMCQCDWTGQRGIPADHWVCTYPPGCTKLNHDSRFYCEICGLSRPNLATQRF